jgi:hypothetical protein
LCYSCSNLESVIITCTGCGSIICWFEGSIKFKTANYAAAPCSCDLWITNKWTHQYKTRLRGTATRHDILKQMLLKGWNKLIKIIHSFQSKFQNFILSYISLEVWVYNCITTSFTEILRYNYPFWKYSATDQTWITSTGCVKRPVCGTMRVHNSKWMDRNMQL